MPSGEFELVIKNLPQRKAQTRCLELVNSATPLKKINSNFYKLVQKIEEVKIPSNSFYEARITLIPKPKTSQEKDRLVSLMNIGAKILNKIRINQK